MRVRIHITSFIHQFYFDSLIKFYSKDQQVRNTFYYIFTQLLKAKHIVSNHTRVGKYLKYLGMSNACSEACSTRERDITGR